tara:strand:- start:2487 stop:2729 length:243 start_codon:yes stop_codon:yes gene_type:complete
VSVVQSGLYRHYKGAEYQVYAVVRHSETEEELVLYKALYGDYGLWVRPLSMFIECVAVDGKSLPRFQFVKEISCPSGALV